MLDIKVLNSYSILHKYAEDIVIQLVFDLNNSSLELLEVWNFR